MWEENDLARLDLETEIDTAVLGDGAFKVTRDESEQRVVVSAPDVQGLYAWWVGDDVRRLWRVASRYELAAEQLVARLGRTPRAVAGQRPQTVDVVEAWTAERFELWVQGELVEERANPYGAIPFVLYPNLPRPKQFWGISDIEPLRESLAELNRALTQLSRILELSGNPIAVLENVEEARDIAVQPGAVWEIPEQARAYLLDLLQGGGVRLHVEYTDLVYRTLHDLSETPRIAFGDGGGDRSGRALQLELDPLLRKVARKRLIRTSALRRATGWCCECWPTTPASTSTACARTSSGDRSSRATRRCCRPPSAERGRRPGNAHERGAAAAAPLSCGPLPARQRALH